jgi:hypothetical protein
MVSQELVRRYWPGEEPLGKRIRLHTGSSFFEVIGVVQDVDNPGLGSAQLVLYVPSGQGKLLLAGARLESPPYQMQFLIRSSGDPAALKSTLHRAALVNDPSLWVNIQTLQELREESVGPVRTFSLLLSALGALALFMAAVGIYAVLAHAVSQRTREIGIRMALGAQRGEIMTLVMQRTLALIAWGHRSGPSRSNGGEPDPREGFRPTRRTRPGDVHRRCYPVGRGSATGQLSAISQSTACQSGASFALRVSALQ